jgi:hypothetical protein
VFYDYDLDPKRARQFSCAENMEIQAKIIGELGAEREIDTSLLEFNLSLTHEERLENHQRALELLNEVLKARKELYGEPESSPEATS